MINIIDVVSTKLRKDNISKWSKYPDDKLSLLLTLSEILLCLWTYKGVRLEKPGFYISMSLLIY